MKKHANRAGRRAWPRAWLVQIITALAIALAVSACKAGPAALYAALLWLVMPLAGGWTAYRAVRGGLLNYAAWIAPPVCLYFAHYAIWRYAPPAGPALVCAFISLVGAAAGEVKNANRSTGKR